jgi:tetratricopeptide (TPR) repeat protein
VLHATNAVLLFVALSRLTNKPWRSLVAAGIFALHPLHVESVAWISERKDVLSGLFFMLTLLAYDGYAKTPKPQNFRPVAWRFTLGLMAKPMLVTLPCVLLLLDFWPLRRINWPLSAPRDILPLLREKYPLFALAAAASLVTYFAQRGASASFASFPFSARLANAFAAYAAYLQKTFWPADLALFYPYHPPPASGVLTGFALLAAGTGLSLALARTRPYLLAGWLWFLGMLVPVLGFAQVGGQFIADRFTYLPMIGLSLAVVWGAADLVESLAARTGAQRLLRGAAAAGAGVALALLASASGAQVQYWQDSETLYNHTLAVTTGNIRILRCLGDLLVTEGRIDEAITQYRKAIAADPKYPIPHNDLAVALQRKGRLDEAIAELNEALRLDPGYTLARKNLEAVRAARRSKRAK